MTGAADAEIGACQATHIWCCICKCPKPYRNQPLPDASRQRRPGFDGDYLICEGCSTALATVYGRTEGGEVRA